MSENFKYQCQRRSTRQHPQPEELIVEDRALLGAGSGGDDGDGNKGEHHDGSWAICADTLVLCAEDHPEEETGAAGNPEVAIRAWGDDPNTGRVGIRGNQGVRITSGPPNLPPANPSTSINGIQIQAGESQQVSVKRGMLATANEIQLNPGLMVVDGGSGTILITSDTLIKLQVANGTCSLVLAPDGVTIKGLLHQIN
jgi:hypothetical protein